MGAGLGSTAGAALATAKRDDVVASATTITQEAASQEAGGLFATDAVGTDKEQPVRQPIGRDGAAGCPAWSASGSCPRWGRVPSSTFAFQI